MLVSFTGLHGWRKGRLRFDSRLWRIVTCGESLPTRNELPQVMKNMTRAVMEKLMEQAQKMVMTVMKTQHIVWYILLSR
jgi:hypothetical protein